MHPPQIHAVGVNLDLGTINFGIKIEKIVEKIKKSIDRGETNKLVGYMFDIKHEVEGYTGKKIDISKQLDQVEREAKSKRQKIEDAYIKQIKKWFIKAEKKHKHRAAWFAKCTDLDIPYTSVEADYNFDMNYLMFKSAKDHDKEIEVPVTVTVGVTLSLAGLFLMLVPIPINFKTVLKNY